MADCKESYTVAKYCELMLGSQRFGHQAHFVDVSVRLVLSIGLVEKESLHTVVELVFVQVSEGLAEEGMHPVSVVGTISVFVVVDFPKSVSESLRVDHWIKSISR